jgi:hypothetical protein
VTGDEEWLTTDQLNEMIAETQATNTMREWEMLSDKERMALTWFWRLRKHKRG